MEEKERSYISYLLELLLVPILPTFIIVYIILSFSETKVTDLISVTILYIVLLIAYFILRYGHAMMHTIKPKKWSNSFIFYFEKNLLFL